MPKGAEEWTTKTTPSDRCVHDDDNAIEYCYVVTVHKAGPATASTRESVMKFKSKSR